MARPFALGALLTELKEKSAEKTSLAGWAAVAAKHSGDQSVTKLTLETNGSVYEFSLLTSQLHAAIKDLQPVSTTAAAAADSKEQPKSARGSRPEKQPEDRARSKTEGSSIAGRKESANSVALAPTPVPASSLTSSSASSSSSLSTSSAGSASSKVRYPKGSAGASAAAAAAAATSSFQMFGAPFATVMKRELERNPHARTPRFMDCAYKSILLRGLETEGVFRLSGTQDIIMSLKAQVDAGKDIDFDSIDDVHNISGLVKLFIREMPQPLLEADMYHEWLAAVNDDDDEPVQVAALTALTRRLPLIARNFLCELFQFLFTVSANGQYNKMMTYNIGKVIGPNILWSKTVNADLLAMQRDSDRINRVCTMLLSNYHTIFAQEIHDAPKVDPSFSVKLMVPQHHSPLTSVAVDNEGFVWTGSAEGLTRTFPSTCDTVKVPESGPVTALLCVNGNLWAAGSTRLDVYGPDHKIKLSLPHAVTALTAHESLVYLSSESTLFCYNSGFQVVQQLAIPGAASAILVDGRRVWLAGPEKIYIFDLNTSSLLHELPLVAKALLYASGRVWAGGLSGDIAVIDALQLELFTTNRNAHRGGLTSLTLVGDQLWSCGHDARIKMWDPVNAVLLKTIPQYQQQAIVGMVTCETRSVPLNAIPISARGPAVPLHLLNASAGADDQLSGSETSANSMADKTMDSSMSSHELVAVASSSAVAGITAIEMDEPPVKAAPLAPSAGPAESAEPAAGPAESAEPAAGPAVSAEPAESAEPANATATAAAAATDTEAASESDATTVPVADATSAAAGVSGDAAAAPTDVSATTGGDDDSAVTPEDQPPAVPARSSTDAAAVPARSSADAAPAATATAAATAPSVELLAEPVAAPVAATPVAAPAAATPTAAPAAATPVAAPAAATPVLTLALPGDETSPSPLPAQLSLPALQLTIARQVVWTVSADKTVVCWVSHPSVTTVMIEDRRQQVLRDEEARREAMKRAKKMQADKAMADWAGGAAVEDSRKTSGGSGFLKLGLGLGKKSATKDVVEPSRKDSLSTSSATKGGSSGSSALAHSSAAGRGGSSSSSSSHAPKDTTAASTASGSGNTKPLSSSALVSGADAGPNAAVPVATPAPASASNESGSGASTNSKRSGSRIGRSEGSRLGRSDAAAATVATADTGDSGDAAGPLPAAASSETIRAAAPAPSTATPPSAAPSTAGSSPATPPTAHSSAPSRGISSIFGGKKKGK